MSPRARRARRFPCTAKLATHLISSPQTPERDRGRSGGCTQGPGPGPTTARRDSLSAHARGPTLTIIALLRFTSQLGAPRSWPGQRPAAMVGPRRRVSRGVAQHKVVIQIKQGVSDEVARRALDDRLPRRVVLYAAECGAVAACYVVTSAKAACRGPRVRGREARGQRLRNALLAIGWANCERASTGRAKTGGREHPGMPGAPTPAGCQQEASGPWGGGRGPSECALVIVEPVKSSTNGGSGSMRLS